jgi:uncharacterized glyoxalase superfamily protein PhnB
MRFMILIKANRSTEAGDMPSEQLLTEMGRFNEDLQKAGVLVSGEGLQPSSKGARVRFSGKQRTVVDGPFTETKELIAGFWIWQVKSKAEAIEWVKRCPNPTGEESEIEIRQVFELDDFGPELTPELRAQEERVFAEAAKAQAQGAKAGAVPPVPEPRGAIPYLIVKGASDAIGFYQRVFGAEVVMRLDAPDGLLMHAELKVGPAHFMLTEERPQHQALSPASLGGTGSQAVIYVPDADAVVDRAVKAGATLTMPVADQFWGDRSGCINDPFGHAWFVSTQKEVPSEAELKQRMAAMFAGG